MNFLFKSINKTLKIRVNIKEQIWQYYNEFCFNEKELHDINVFGVYHNEKLLDIVTDLSELNIDKGDTVIVECEIPKKETEEKKDNKRKRKRKGIRT